MLRLNNFVDNFQKDHSKLINLVTSFREAIESTNHGEAKEILTKIDNLVNGHFNFEENYLYPRLRRLISQITQNLHREQQKMKEFIKESRSFLDKHGVDKNRLSDILDTLPQLSKFFKDCNDLVFLIEKFDKKDKDDLELRFKECCGRSSLVSV
jgi:hemerythrin